MIDLLARLQGKKVAEVVNEWHSWWIGFFEVACFSIPAKFPKTEFARQEMEEEYHYYMFGRALGILAWLGLAVAIKYIFF